MSSSYSPDLRIELIGTGDQAGVWGATTNNNLAYVIEQSVAGYISVAVASANQALTYINGGSPTAADNQAVHASLALTTSTGANFAVYAPPASKQYTIYNASSYTATIYNSTVIGNTTAAGTGVAIPAGKTMTVWSDGTNFAQQNTHLISPTIAGGTLTSSALTSPTLTTPALGTPTSGTLTNCTGLPVATGISGLGSGVATFLATPSSANLASAVSDETGSGALVFANSPTLVTPALGTPSSGTLTNATGLPLTTGVTGTLPVANGGTGTTSLTANNVLLGNGTSAVQVVAPGTSGNVLTSNGTTWASTALPTVTTGAGTVTSGNTFTATTGSTGKCLIQISAYIYASYGVYGNGTVSMVIGGTTRASQSASVIEFDGRLSSSTPTITYLYSGSANASVTVTYSYSGSANSGTAYYAFTGT